MHGLRNTLHSSASFGNNVCFHRKTATAAQVLACFHYKGLLVIQGWIPRSGLQYGTDLVLYEQHPSLVHSSLCVILVPTAPPPADFGQHSPQAGSTQAAWVGVDGDLSWHDVEGLDRLCTRVSFISHTMHAPHTCPTCVSHVHCAPLVCCVLCILHV